jgi:hypothetical protein
LATACGVVRRPIQPPELFRMNVLATSATLSTSPPSGTARFTVSPVCCDSLSMTGRSEATKSRSRMASVPSLITSRPSRNRRPERVSRPARSSTPARRDAVDLCTPMRAAISVTPSSARSWSKLVSSASTRSADW